MKKAGLKAIGMFSLLIGAISTCSALKIFLVYEPKE